VTGARATNSSSSHRQSTKLAHSRLSILDNVYFLLTCDCVIMRLCTPGMIGLWSLLMLMRVLQCCDPVVPAMSVPAGMQDVECYGNSFPVHGV
jgi:hypothetical protein